MLSVFFPLCVPFWQIILPCSPYRGIPRTLDALVAKLIVWVKTHLDAPFDVSKVRELISPDDSAGNDWGKEGKLAA